MIILYYLNQMLVYMQNKVNQKFHKSIYKYINFIGA